MATSSTVAAAAEAAVAAASSSSGGVGVGVGSKNKNVKVGSVVTAVVDRGNDVDGDDEEKELVEDRLSEDLALFLSNPSLRKSLTDGSLDLEHYSYQVEEELRVLERQCIDVYRGKREEILELQKEAQSCSNILLSLNEMLLGFQTDLFDLSMDIRQLQKQSKVLDVQLKNRRNAEYGVRIFLQQVYISPNLAKILTEENVSTKRYELAVQELEQLHRNTASTSSTNNTAAASDLGTCKSRIDNDNDRFNRIALSASSSDEDDIYYSSGGDGDKTDEEAASRRRESRRKKTKENKNKTTTDRGRDGNTVYWCPVGIVPSRTVAGKEMSYHIQTLRQHTVCRIRDYFIQQLQLLRKPQTNVRMIQVHGLLKHVVLYDFVCIAANEIGQELYNIYAECMSKTLVTLFRTYQTQLLQLDLTKTSATRYDVIAIDDSIIRDSITTKAKKRTDVFCLGARAADCLPHIPSVHGGGRGAGAAGGGYSSASNSAASSGNARGRKSFQQQQQQRQQQQQQSQYQQQNQPILAHVALAENKRYPYEMLFRSLMGHLVDAVTNEHVFCRQFFHRDAFQALFAPTISLLLEQVENYLFTCYDAICLLLLIKITHSYKRILHIRQIYSLDPFLDQVTHLLWPRLKTVMDGHLRSIKQATAAKLGGSSGAGAGGSSGGGVVSGGLGASFLSTVVGAASGSNSSSSGGIAGMAATSCHYVSRRYAEFASSILLILHSGSADGGGSASLSSAHHLRRTASSGNSGSSSGYEARSSAFHGTGRKDSDAAAASSYKKSSASGKVGSHGMTDTSERSTGSYSKTAGDKLLEDLSEITDEYLALLERLADDYASGSTISSATAGGALASSSAKKRIVFMINNLDHVVCIFQERRVISGNKELNRFVELLMQQRELFVEEELLVGFSKMIAFVQQTESHLASLVGASKSSSGAAAAAAAASSLDVNVQVVESLVLDFASNWRARIDQINRDVLSYFSNFRNGMEILKQVLTQLLLYYTRFQDIIRKVWRNKPPAFCSDLVSTASILAEIKKYALAI